MVGRIELRWRPAERIEDVQVFPAADGMARVRIAGRLGRGGAEAFVDVALRDAAGTPALRTARLVPGADGRFVAEVSGRLAVAPRLWSEFAPALYQLAAELRVAGRAEAVDRREVRFGFREVGARGGRINRSTGAIFSCAARWSARFSR